YIPPETIEYQVGADAIDVVRGLLDQFQGSLTDEIIAGIDAKGLTLDQAIIIASIVEREAVIDEERPLIAAVYTKRFLEPENPQTVGQLNADPTLQYGLTTGEQRPEGHPLLADSESATLPADEWASIDWWPQLQTGGADVALEEFLLGFQTYTQAGLPPMPIAAPRIGSVEAVATAPIDDGYLFFVAGCPDGTRDGSHYFAMTLDEHNANIARANEECAGQ
ncbi:MAG: endolytic transglycosylase MltG, partial [Candidatus Limnocylindria bacterium]